MKRILAVGTFLVLPLTVKAADTPSTNPPAVPDRTPVFYSSTIPSPKDTIDKTILQWATGIKQAHEELQKHKTLIVTALSMQAGTAAEAATTIATLGTNKRYRQELKEEIEKIPVLVSKFNPKTDTPAVWAESLSYREKMRISEMLSLPKGLRDQYPTDEKVCSIM